MAIVLKTFRDVVAKYKHRKDRGEKPDVISEDLDEPDDDKRLRRIVHTRIPDGGCPTTLRVTIYGRSGTGMNCLYKALCTGCYLPGYDPTGGGETGECRVLRDFMDRSLMVHMNVMGHPTPMVALPLFPRCAPRYEEQLFNFYAVTYNVGDRTTFDELKAKYDEVLSAKEVSRNSVVRWDGGILISMASDLAYSSGAVTSEEGKQFAQTHSIPFHETSAMEGLGCDKAGMNEVMRLLLLQLPVNGPHRDVITKYNKHQNDRGEKRNVVSDGADEMDDDTRLKQTLENVPNGSNLRVCVYGGTGTGKQCLLNSFEFGYYRPGYDPATGRIGAFTKQMVLMDHQLILDMSTWHKDFPVDVTLRLRLHSYPDPKLYLFYMITYNVGDRTTFDELEELHKEVLSARDKDGKAIRWRGGMLVALASDLCNFPGAVAREEGERFAEDKRIIFCETSAKTGLGCEREGLEQTVRLFLLQLSQRTSLQRFLQLSLRRLRQ